MDARQRRLQKRPTLDHAYENMRLFIADAGVTATFRRDSEAKEPDDYYPSSFAFLVTIPDPETGRTQEVPMLMPGFEARDVRFLNMLDPPAGNGHVFSIVVGESSWWWPLAVESLREKAVGERQLTPPHRRTK